MCSALGIMAGVGVPVRADLPDLSVTKLEWSGQAVGGQQLAFSFTVTNLGNGSATGSWYEELVLSTNATMAGAVSNGVYEFYLDHNVPANGTYTVSKTVKLPGVP